MLAQHHQLFRALRLAMILLFLYSDAQADITITEQTTGHAGSSHGQAQRITAIKGSKLRIEEKRGEDALVTIYDLDAGSEIILNYKQKEAEIQSFVKQNASAEKKVPVRSVQSRIEPTGQHKQILAKDCDEYAFQISVPVYQDGSITLLMTGTAWIAPQSREGQEYADFANHASRRGLILGWHSDNPAFVALARADTEFYHLMGRVHGPALVVDQKIKFEGGFLAAILNKSASGERSATVTSLSMDLVPEQQFTIPAGWKIRTK